MEITQVDEHAEHIRLNGNIMLYRLKAPFVRSGRSILGAIEYDKVADKLKCHECGEWFKGLNGHVRHSHDMKAAEYKRIHGLRQSTALVGEYSRKASIVRMEKLRANPNILAKLISKKRRGAGGYHGISQETANTRGHCHAQVVEHLQQLAARFGRTPTSLEIKASGMHTGSLCWAFNIDKPAEAIALAGLKPRSSGEKIGGIKYSKELLIELLRDFWVMHQRVPSTSDMKRGLLPNVVVFKYHFVTWQAALEAAGLKYIAYSPERRSDASKRNWVARFQKMTPAQRQEFGRQRNERLNTARRLHRAGNDNLGQVTPEYVAR